MSMHDKIWSKLPEQFNFIAWDKSGFSGFCQHPTFNSETGCWLAGDSRQSDRQEINPTSLPRPFQRINRLNARVAILQRPESWDGELRAGDAVKAKRIDHMFSVSGFFNDEKVWLESPVTNKSTITPLDRIVLVNGMVAKGRLSVRKTQPADQPGLPPEVHNDAAVDADRAMEVMRRICRG